MLKNIAIVIAAIDYIEKHLNKKIDLEVVANAVHYSKYHLHRLFTDTVGLTIHDYVQRRQLTEATKLLVFSDKPIIEIALIAGYESQQSFTTAFKAMYKKSPNQYRANEEFYPLQLRYILIEEPTKAETAIDWQKDITLSTMKDIPQWMDLLNLVIDGFPHLNKNEYIELLENCISENRALIMKDGGTAIGIMAFSYDTGSIDFFGIHPQYRKRGIAKAFLRKVMTEFLEDPKISITTFREGDKADLGYREIFKSLGFAEAELLIEFGYPTQKFVLHRSDLQDDLHE